MRKKGGWKNRGGEGVENVKEMRGMWRRRERKKIKGEGVKWCCNGVDKSLI